MDTDNKFPIRSHPARFPPLSRRDQPVVVFTTVCVAQSQHLIANFLVKEMLHETWQQISDWKVGTYVIMPDHVHFLCSPSRDGIASFRQWMRAWKSISARKCISILGKKVSWQREFWDTQIRNSEHLRNRLSYMAHNPVRKKLCKSPEEWAFRGEVFDIPSPIDFDF